MKPALLKKLCLSLTICLAVAACKSSEERAEDHYQSGLQLVETGDYDRALVEFRNTLKFAEGHMDARRQMAGIHIKQGNKKAAYRNLLHVVEKNPDDLEGRTTLSILAFEGRDWDEFDRHGKVAVEQAPDNPASKAIDVGMRYRQAVLGEDSETRNLILAEAEALKKDLPANAILRQVLIDGYVSQEEYTQALELIDENIKENPKNLQLYTGKLELLARIGDEVALEAEMRKMVEMFPQEEGPQNTLLRYYMSRQRLEDAENFLREIVANSKDTKRNDAYIGLIEFLRQTKGPDVALEELEKELAKEQSSETLQALRAAINFDTGKRDEAIAEMQKIVTAENTALSKTEMQNVKVTLAKMLVSTGNEVGARKLIEEIIEADPNAGNALKMQASWMVADDNTDGAITAMRTALEQDPQDVEAMTIMAQAYQRSGNKDLMMNFLSLAVEASNNAPEQSLRYAQALSESGNLLQAESTLISSLRITPGNLPVLSALGKVYLGLDDMPRARQVVETLRKSDNKDAHRSANALEVEILSRESGSDEAIKFLQELAGQDGDEGIAAKLALIRARIQSGEIDQALSDMKALVSENPDDLRLRNALALTYASTQNYDEAITELEAILKERPEMVGSWLQLARVHTAKGDDDGARSAIDRGLEAAPDAPDLLWGKASYLQNAGEFDGAIEIYEKLYEKSSDSPVIANNLASLLATAREDEESLARARKIARRLKTSDVAAFQDTYGWILYRSNEWEEAVKYLEPAAKGLPQDPSVQFHLGMAYASLGRSDEALEYLNKAVSIAGPLGDTKMMDEARSKITELKNLKKNNPGD